MIVVFSILGFSSLRKFPEINYSFKVFAHFNGFWLTYKLYFFPKLYLIVLPELCMIVNVFYIRIFFFKEIPRNKLQHQSF